MYDKPRAKGNRTTLIKQTPAWDVDGDSGAAGPRADLVMGSLAHAVVVAGGWCRISTNFATPSHMLDRLVNYKQVLMDEQRNVSTLTTGRLAFNLDAITQEPAVAHIGARYSRIGSAFFNYHNWAGQIPWVRQLSSSLLLINCMVRALEAKPTFTSHEETVRPGFCCCEHQGQGQ
eukprot:1157375-Pelagomonas_calceolata.AAC.4